MKKETSTLEMAHSSVQGLTMVMIGFLLRGGQMKASRIY